MGPLTSAMVFFFIISCESPPLSALPVCRLFQAYSVYDEEIGYCQGQSFLAAVLLLHVSTSSKQGLFGFWPDVSVLRTLWNAACLRLS